VPIQTLAGPTTATPINDKWLRRNAPFWRLRFCGVAKSRDSGEWEPAASGKSDPAGSLIEEDFASLESEVSALLAEMRAGNLEPDDGKRILLSEFLAAQKVRVPAFRNAVERFYLNVVFSLD
jgi:Protein of unknown function (DUF4238)